MDPLVPYFLELPLQPLVLAEEASLDLVLLLTPDDHPPLKLVSDAFAPGLRIHCVAVAGRVYHVDDEALRALVTGTDRKLDESVSFLSNHILAVEMALAVQLSDSGRVSKLLLKRRIVELLKEDLDEA